MRLLLLLAREYPKQSIIALIGLFASSLTEGLSMSMLLPLVTMTIDARTNIDPAEAQSQVGEAGELEQTIRDTIQSLGITPTIELLLMVFIAGIVLKSILGLFVARQIGYTVAQVATNLRLSLLNAMLATRWEFYIHQRVGKVANAMSAEAMRASSTYSAGLKLASLIFETAVYCALALLVSWQAMLASLAVGGLIMFSLHWLIRMSKKAGDKQTELMKSLITRLTDSLRSVKPLKAMAREDLAGAVLASETWKLNRSLRKQVLSGAGLNAFQAPLFSVTVVAALYVALIYWQLSLAAIMVMIILLTRVLKRLGNIQKAYQSLVAAESAYWSLQDGIEKAKQAHEPLTGELKPRFEQEIRFHDVQFAYDQNKVLRGVSLLIPAGSFTTIVGPSGEGKTTIVDLVTGLLRPQAGAITVDDVPLEQLQLKQWRRLIGYVPQDTLLLHDSVMANVTLGDPELDVAAAKRALKEAGAWEFVDKLPEGIGTQVGEHGAKLSGGQRQRIVIARALAHRPKLLILDEATSALDEHSEAAICQTLQKLKGSLTILAISHRPGFVEAADIVYRIERGTVEKVMDRDDVTAQTPAAWPQELQGSQA